MANQKKMGGSLCKTNKITAPAININTSQKSTIASLIDDTESEILKPQQTPNILVLDNLTFG
jgi:hypothetical protein